MSTEEEEQKGPEPTPTISAGGMTFQLLPAGIHNVVSNEVKPVYPKEEWAGMDPGTRCKVFERMQREILTDGKLSLLIIIGAGLEALKDTVAIQSKLQRIIHHFQMNDMTKPAFQIMCYDRSTRAVDECLTFNMGIQMQAIPGWNHS